MRALIFILVVIAGFCGAMDEKQVLFLKKYRDLNRGFTSPQIYGFYIFS
jgi:hypothetical protein